MPQFSQSIPKRLLKMFLASIFFAASELIRAVRVAFAHQLPYEPLIIFYHQVFPSERKRFARQMDHLLRWAHPVSTAQLDQTDKHSRPVAVTVDDGWLSFVSNALPETKRRLIPITTFIIADRMGSSFGDANDRIVSEQELESIRDDLVTIGSHTASHPCLTTLKEDDIRLELRSSRDQLMQALKADVRLFCFPFGAYEDEHIALCREAGYDRVFISTPVPKGRRFEGYVSGRIRVDPTDWPLEFHLKLMGAYYWISMLAALRQRLRVRWKTTQTPLTIASGAGVAQPGD